MNDTTTTKPVANCIAALDDIIRQQLPILRGGDVVARWSDGADIVVEGRRPSRGWTADIFGTSFVRWTCAANGRRGLFGKGLVEVKAADVAHLPVVR